MRVRMVRQLPCCSHHSDVDACATAEPMLHCSHHGHREAYARAITKLRCSQHSDSNAYATAIHVLGCSRHSDTDAYAAVILMSKGGAQLAGDSPPSIWQGLERGV